MKETIYLTVSKSKVEKMTKSLPDVRRGEIPIKVLVEVEEQAFRTPVIEKTIYIDDWREGIDMADVDFNGSAITQEEAQMLRDRRLEKMREILESQGYTVEKPEKEE